MQNKEQVFLYMKEEIERTARLEEEQILQEAKELEALACKQIEQEATRDAVSQLDKELAKITSAVSIEASSNNEMKTRLLVEKREQYVTTIFKEAKEKLIDFVSSDKYKEYMLTHMQQVASLYPMKNSILYIRKRDISLQKDLASAYGNDIQVKVSSTITIGGFIVENKEISVVVDETLDFALANQKEWFVTTSNLMIK